MAQAAADGELGMRPSRRRKYARGETAKLTEQGFCRRCGLHVTQIVTSMLSPELHLCDLGARQVNPIIVERMLATLERIEARLISQHKLTTPAVTTCATCGKRWDVGTQHVCKHVMPGEGTSQIVFGGSK